MDPASEIKTKIPKETVEQLSKMSFNHKDKTRFSNEGLLMTQEMLRIYVLEAATRAAQQAKAEGMDKVELEHVEKVLPQFLLDFQ